MSKIDDILNAASEAIKADMLAKFPPRPENTRPIVTSHIYPPIPIRDYDWMAWFDENEEGPQGFGRTETEAKADLLDNYGDEK